MPELKPNTERQIEITAADLPLACPMPDMLKWNAHPRVYLSLDEHGEARCPYCSTRYHLQGGKPDGHH
ncbi:MAG: zinc-finger domain-containing protein [Paludibacterium sp.]|uniref:zinc-finger domain-containing protein n=1 Tax=Paludibacterium sp. TaxID=1917523 RepID=UPI0025ECEC7B|nr:zinc-finger domain-containing protein [Paludibacterium sp.]MBV8046551.1 zinc-finger domain-containing protein [Paludibacterium sp.]MBV8648246.1 zinc-finger domain-containing protein [Paludibacterium sp.]